MSRSIPTIDDLLAEVSWVRRLARGLVRDAGRAEDLTQDAIAAYLERPPRRWVSARAWLSGVVRNLARMQARSEGRRRLRDQGHATGAQAPGTDVVVGRAERCQAVGAALLGLDEPYRTTLLLRYLEALSDEEIAARMGVSRSTVRVRAQRGLARLRGRLHERFGAACGAILMDLAGGVIVKTGTKVGLAAALLCLFSAGVWMLGGFGDRNTVVEDRGPEPAQQVAALPTPEETPPMPAAAAPAIDGERSLVKADESTGAAEPAPAPAPAAEHRVRGKVVNLEGAAIPEAEVWLFRRSDVEARRETAPLAQTLTDAEGRFELGPVEEFVRTGLFARAEGHAQAFQWTEERGDTTLTLGPAVRLHGRVLEEGSRQPVAGIELRVRRVSLGDEGPAFAASVTTDATGGYAFEGLEGGEVVILQLSASGVAPRVEFLRLPTRAQAFERDLLVPARAWVEGKVVDSVSFAPVAKATIRAASDPPIVLAVTGPDGTFRFERFLPIEGSPSSMLGIGGGDGPGKLSSSLRVDAPGYCLTTVSPDKLLGEEVQLPLLPAASIEGLVLDAEGQPTVAEVRLATSMPSVLDAGLYAHPALDSRRTTSDEEGRFLLPRVPWMDTFIELEVSEPGQPPLLVPDVAPRRAGETRFVEVRLAAASLLEGVVHVNGQPTEAYVYVEDGPNGARAFQKTDLQGAFAFRNLPEGSYKVEAVTADGTTMWSPEQRIDVPHPTPVQLHIVAEFDRFTGQVRNESGEPVPDQSVVAFVDRPIGGAMSMVEGSVQTDAEGRFDLVVKPRDDTRYRVGLYWGKAWIGRGDLSPNGADLHLTVPELCELRLTLVSSEGEAITKARFAWSRPGGETFDLYGGRETASDGKGTFLLELPRGDVDLKVSSPTHGLEERTERLDLDCGEGMIERLLEL